MSYYSFKQYTADTSFQDREEMLLLQRPKSFNKGLNRPMKVLCTFCVTIMLIRCILLILRFASSNLAALSCSNLTNHQSSIYDAWIVVVYYIILEVMRFAEYIVIGISFCKHWYTPKGNGVSMMNVIRKRFVILLFCLLPGLMAVFVVICQIAMEEYHEHIESNDEVCLTYINVSKIYFAYCFLNFGRYFLAFFVRLAMVVSTIRITEIWDNSYNRLSEYILNKHTLSGANPNVSIIAREIHNKLSDEYNNSGVIVERLFKPFKPWFIIPWIAYAYETSISAQNVLSPWEEGRKTFSAWVKVYTILYSVTQFCLLIIQYLCALKINGCHQEYCRNTRKLQMEAMQEANTDESKKITYRAIARTLHVENQVNYDFSPEIWGIHMNINMDTPMFSILLLLNAFVSLSQSFFDSNAHIYVL